MSEAQRAFGEAVLLDFHSMPHERWTGSRAPAGRVRRWLLGDRFGASAATEVVDVLEDAFLSEGLSVIRNAPFAGAFVTQQLMAAPRAGAMRCKGSRSTGRSTMNERVLWASGNFDAMKRIITNVIDSR